MLRIKAATALEGFRLRLELSDGSERIVDVGPLLQGSIFDEIRRDPAVFATVQVDAELGTVVWPNGADLDPDVLVRGRSPASREAAVR